MAASTLLPAFELTPSPMISSTSHKRRPHCSQHNCPTLSRSSGFSDLPWASFLDKTAEELDLQDIADLSQIPIDESTISSAGPVRRRKTSFRASPLRSAAGSRSQQRDRSPAPSVQLPFRSISSTPATPRPRSSCARIIFHDLMPVFTRDIHTLRGANNSPSTP